MTEGLARMSAGQRRVLQVGGVLCLVAGLVLFLMGPLAALRSFGSAASGDGGVEDAVGGMMGLVLFSFLGMLFLVAGAVMARFGFMRPVAELTATETAGALEHAAGAAGRGLRGAGLGAGREGGEVVKVKCRGCGFLDSEDARFCSGCGASM